MATSAKEKPISGIKLIARTDFEDPRHATEAPESSAANALTLLLDAFELPTDGSLESLKKKVRREGLAGELSAYSEVFEMLRSLLDRTREFESGGPNTTKQILSKVDPKAPITKSHQNKMRWSYLQKVDRLNQRRLPNFEYASRECICKRDEHTAVAVV
ncbi:MAG: hypothetical protein Q9171_005808 [Xanthocarpia ochracea]